jgi:tetratricopeptide (TPR) repeat protein
MRAERLVLGLGLMMVCAIAACATRTATAPVPVSPAFPDFVYPVVPRGLGGVEDAARIDRGWRFLQANDLLNANREFGVALKRMPALYPARAGSAYVALAGADFNQALGAFDAVLQAAPMYVPALVGRGQTLLGLKRDRAALEVFEAALAVDASLIEVRRRVDVLRFRALQDLIETARTATAAGRLDEAAAAYEGALAASPDSAFLYRELGLVARRQGSVDSALSRFRRAVELDPADNASLIQIGELLEARQDFAGAEAAYRRVIDIDPSADLGPRLKALEDRGRDATLPAQLRSVPAATQIARGELAALIGVRLDDVLRLAPVREVVMTDVAGHWAAVWITSVARAGVIDPFENHTFQPGNPVTRADLAGAVSRLVTLLAANRPDLRPHLTARPSIADMTAGHLSYPAASVAVASGMMSLGAGSRFEVARLVSGAEATETVARVRALAGAAR